MISNKSLTSNFVFKQNTTTCMWTLTKRVSSLNAARNQLDCPLPPCVQSEFGVIKGLGNKSKAIYSGT